MNTFTKLLGAIGGGRVALSRLERNGVPYARILVSNPSRKNALSGKMMVELADCVTELERAQDIAFVQLVGDGDFFCSGADLSVAKEIDGAAMCSLMQDTTTRLRNLSAISVSHIVGGAYGGGTELASCTDFRCMHPQAVWRSVHAKMGVSPGWGGGNRIARLVGSRGKALQVFSGQKLTSGECVSLGLVDHLVESDAELLERFDHFLALPPQALRACKQAVIAGEIYGNNKDILNAELEAFRGVWGGQANQQALERPK